MRETKYYHFSSINAQAEVHELDNPIKPESLNLRIEDWANSRLLIIDRSKGRTYLQASASHETGEGGPCSICEKRMIRLRNQAHSRGQFYFVRFNRYHSHYVEFEGIPVDTSPETLTRFLGVKVRQ